MYCHACGLPWRVRFQVVSYVGHEWTPFCHVLRLIEALIDLGWIFSWTLRVAASLFKSSVFIVISLLAPSLSTDWLRIDHQLRWVCLPWYSTHRLVAKTHFNRCHIWHLSTNRQRLYCFQFHFWFKFIVTVPAKVIYCSAVYLNKLNRLLWRIESQKSLNSQELRLLT